MLKKILKLSFLLFLSLSLFKTASANITAGLIAQYRLDENSGTSAYDSSGNANTGVISGAVWAVSKISNALNFNGTSALVSVADPANSSLDLGTGDFSISAWVKTSVSGITQTIVGKRSGSAGIGYDLRINTTGNLSLYLRDSDDAAQAVYTSTASGLTDGNWHNVAVTATRSGTAVFYIDGAASGSSNITGRSASLDNSYNFYIGASQSNGYFNGIIDDVRVYSRALTASDIAEIYSYTGGGSSSSSQTSSQSSSSQSSSDIILPVIKIISPVNDSEYYTNHSSVTVYGTAFDNKLLSSITCALSTASSCSITGMTNWIASNLLLKQGSNILTITAKDSSNNLATIQLNINYTPSTADQGWKNHYSVWTDSPGNAVKYAKQMGYDYINGLNGKEADYKNPKTAGLKFYIFDPQYNKMAYSPTSRNIDIGKYTDSQKNWYEKYMVWKSKDPFPNNMASGWFLESSNGAQFSSMWDFQQQAVIDYVVEKTMDYVRNYKASSGLDFAGFQFDVPDLSGDFHIWNGTGIAKKDLKGWTGKDSGVNHIGIDGVTMTDYQNDKTGKYYATYDDGLAAFYKQLISRMRQEYPNAKWAIDPARIYDTGNYDEWVYRVKDRADKNELTPDFIGEEGATTDFVNDINFNSGMRITADMVGNDQRSEVGESTNRLIAGKAGVKGAWYHILWGNLGGIGNMPKFASIADVYPRLKLVGAIPGWDNLLNVPLNQRSWDGAIYKSPNSYISSDVMYSHHWKTPNKLFAVLNNVGGVITLRPNENITSINCTNGFFEETGNCKNDFIKSGNLASGYTLTYASTTKYIDPSNNQNKGYGYVITLSASAPDTSAPITTITSPTFNPTYSTSVSPLNILGTASDNVGVTSVSWTNSRGGSGTASGTNTWSVNGIALQIGEKNIITVTAKDAMGNVGKDILTVTYSATAIPTVTTNTATNITNNSATLKGTVNPNNLSTTAYLEYGLSANSYTTKTSNQTLTGTSNLSISANTGSILTPNTVYHFRAVAQNSLGTVKGGDQSFTTLKNADTSKPVGSIAIKDNADSTDTNNTDLNLSATDNVGIVGYYISESSALPDTKTNWTSVPPTLSFVKTISFILSPEEGTKTIYAFYKDAAGNVSDKASASIIFKIPASSSSSSGGGGGGGGWGGGSTNVSPGPFKIKYPASESSITEDMPTFVWETSYDTDLSHYELYLDDSLLQSDIKTTSFMTDESISCGDHSWYVRAIDQRDNQTDTDPSDFTVNCDNSDSSSSSSQGNDFIQNASNQDDSEQLSSSYQFKKYLSFGIKGNDVRELQKRLTSKGVYKGPITGYFGTLTREAVKKYQAKNKIPQVGVVGPKTLALLNKSSSSTSSSQGFSLRGLVELLISIGVISPEKAELARIALRSMEGR